MIVPSAVNMKFKFPQFIPIADGSIEFAIEEAVVACGGDGWVDDANQTLAITYYAAHLLQISLMRAASGTGQLVSSESIGEESTSYVAPDRDKSGSYDFNSTQYGIRFRELVDKNFPAVLTVGSAIRM